MTFHRSIHLALQIAILNHPGSLTASLMHIQVLMTTQKPGSFERGLPLHREVAEAIGKRQAAHAENAARWLVQMPYEYLANLTRRIPRRQLIDGKD